MNVLVNAAIVAASTALTLILGYGGTFLWTGQEPIRFVVNRFKPLDPAGIGIWQHDARLGYSHVPLASGRHHGDAFDVRYSIDATGCRVTRDPATPNGSVLVLGDSFTFGHGVSDTDAYPAQLGMRWSSRKVRNCAGMGWGTGQALLVLDDALAKPEKPVAIIYGWIGPDIQRNYLRKSWLDLLGRFNRRNVYFDVIDGRLTYRGTSGPEIAVPDDVPELATKEMAVTQALIRQMAKAAAPAPFYVVLLPYGIPADPVTERLADFMRNNQITFIDLRGISIQEPVFYPPPDTHPRPQWHRAVASAIAERVPLE